MANKSKYMTLVLGLASPALAAVLGRFTYRTLTRASSDVDSDYVFRLVLTAIAMAVPFVLTVWAARREMTAGAPVAIGVAKMMDCRFLIRISVPGSINETGAAARERRCCLVCFVDDWLVAMRCAFGRIQVG